MAESPFKFCTNCGQDDWNPKSDREFVCKACGFQHFITPIPAAVALILDAQDRVLVIRRAHEPGFGLLGLPGGVIEPEETGEMAVAREVHEEVGINLPASAFTYYLALNNRYPFQGYAWPTLDLCYMARVPDFNHIVLQASEVSEFMICPLDEVPLHEFAFDTNAEAIRRWRASRAAVA